MWPFNVFSDHKTAFGKNTTKNSCSISKPLLITIGHGNDENQNNTKNFRISPIHPNNNFLSPTEIVAHKPTMWMQSYEEIWWGNVCEFQLMLFQKWKCSIWVEHATWNDFMLSVIRQRTYLRARSLCILELEILLFCFTSSLYRKSQFVLVYYLWIRQIHFFFFYWYRDKIEPEVVSYLANTRKRLDRFEYFFSLFQSIY